MDRHDDRAALLAAVIVMDLSPTTTLRLALERMGTLLGATTLAIAMAVLVSLVPKLMHVEVVTEKES